MKKQNTPAMSPIHRADIGVTNPEAGVIATSPATAPEIAPSAEGLPCRIHSATLQPIAAAAAPKCVATNADAASVPELKAELALNPNQPTHNTQHPRGGRHRHLRIPQPFPQIQRSNQRRNPRGHMHHRPTREVERRKPP